MSGTEPAHSYLSSHKATEVRLLKNVCSLNTRIPHKLPVKVTDYKFCQGASHCYSKEALWVLKVQTASLRWRVHLSLQIHQSVTRLCVNDTEKRKREKRERASSIQKTPCNIWQQSHLKLKALWMSINTLSVHGWHKNSAVVDSLCL